MCKDWGFGFANTPGTVLGIPILRTLAFRGLFWGPLGNLPYGTPEQGLIQSTVFLAGFTYPLHTSRSRHGSLM